MEGFSELKIHLKMEQDKASRPEQDIVKLVCNDYRKRIEKQTGRQMTDFEFLSGIMEARRDSLNHQAETYFASNKEANVNKPKCPTCQSENIQKISAMTKAGSVALWGIFSQKVKKQWHCNSCGSEW